MTLFTPHVLEFFKEELSTLPGNYLEIGVYNGLSIKELALLYPSKRIIGVDPFIEDGCTSHKSGQSLNEQLSAQRINTLDNVKNISNIDLHQLTSVEFYTKNIDVLHEFNVSAVFVDGSHHYVDVVNDYKLAMDLLNKKRGIICFDDLQVPDVAKAVEEFEVFAHDRITEKIVMGPYLTNRIFRIKEL